MGDLTLDTSRRITLGIWGLGRGMSFYKTCEALGIDVVAGCDYNEHMRNNFLTQNPDAFVTADYEEFLNYDMDAVLLATYSTEHALDTIRCLKAGKHVLAEVTSFHTMGEGVDLVEAVEESGLVYNLAENYPFSKVNMFLEEQYKKGLFGELQYSEFEYNHNCITLAYTYIDGMPVQPGNLVHFWRSWINFHYYNTHSLGPIMNITGLRPTRVVALPCEQGVPGFLDAQYQGPAPSLTNMSNGSVFRNFMGATTNDTHIKRIWGTRGSAEDIGQGLHLKLGGGYGQTMKMQVNPEWPEGFAELAEKTGHGGGDFWVLYYFSREIREGIPGPFTIYNAADCTSAGILAYRSACENGVPYDIPDFSKKEDRDKWRNDSFAQARYDVSKGCFADNADYEITQHFSKTMSELIPHAHSVRSIKDWASVASSLDDAGKDQLRGAIDDFSEKLSEIRKCYESARKISDTYPQSDGGRVLGDVLDLGEEQIVMSSGFESSLLELKASI